MSLKNLMTFQDFSTNEEVVPTSADNSIMGALAKKIYLDLKKTGKEVQLDYQNKNLSKQGNSKELGSRSIDGYKVILRVDFVMVQGLDESLTKELAQKYSSNDVEAEERSNMLYFRLKEKTRSVEQSKNRNKTETNPKGFQYADVSYQKANRSQRNKGLKGVSSVSKKSY